MFNYILAGILAILIWQLFIFLIYWASGTDKDKTTIIAMGAFSGISIFIARIVNAIKLKWCKHNLVTFRVKNKFKHTNPKNGLTYYTDGNIYYTTKKIKTSLQCDSHNQVRSCNSDIMYLQFLDSPIKVIPYKCQIWKGEKSFYDIDMTQFMQTKRIDMSLNGKELKV